MRTVAPPLVLRTLFMRFLLILFVACLTGLVALPVLAGDLAFSRAELEARWEARIRHALAEKNLPKIDMETTFLEEHVVAYIPDVFSVMDDLGIALTAADGNQRPKKDDSPPGYRWSTYILDLVNRHPDRFVPTANGGTNPSWLLQKSGPVHFIDQMEAAIRSGAYAHMGEFDFRHYMSAHQCAAGRTDRDNDIPLDSPNGRRVFALAAETGVPFVAHVEAEDKALDGIEAMLAAYPKAKVVVAHFAQIRHPEKQKRFTPAYVRGLFAKYPNLYFDLSVGHPNRPYKCAGSNDNGVLMGDTALWEGGEGWQIGTVKAEWRGILTEFSTRFVFGTDYGPGRGPLPTFLKNRVANFDLIVRDLPDEAKHDIAYRNAWKLLTGREWRR